MSILKLITSQKERFEVLTGIGYYNHLPDDEYLKRRYLIKTGSVLNLENPQKFNEKLQWLKLYNRKPEYTALVDKYAVRRFVAEKIGEEYLIPLLGGPWKSFDEIDFSKLPEQFVLKCTHDSGGLVICKDKKNLDLKAAKKKIEKCLKRNFYSLNREWVYKDVPPRIIAEQYMEDKQTKELRDYKFFCFNGEPKALFVATDRQTPGEEVKFDFFDMQYNHIDVRNGHENAKCLPEKPQQFALMAELAKKLSADMPHVRVDFYEVNGTVYFGEMTFFHFSGMVPFEPEEWDYTFGSWLDLPVRGDSCENT